MGRFFKALLFLLPFLPFGFSCAQMYLKNHGAALDSTKRLADFSIEIWNADKGFLMDGANDIAQGPDGFLWVATYNGLLRFDGVSFKKYDSHNNSLFGGNAINSLFVSQKDSTVWAAGHTDGLLGYRNGKFTKYAFQYPLECVFTDGKGNKWLGTKNNGLYCINAAGETVEMSAKIAPEGMVVQDLALDSAGILWVATDNKGLLYVKDGVLKRWQNEPLAKSHVNVLWAATDGLWIGTENGLGLGFLKNGTLNWMPAFKGLDIYTLLMDDLGVLWLGTSRGLARYFPKSGQTEFLAGRQPLQNNKVSGLCFDREGNLWGSLDRGGVFSLKDSRFVNYNSRNGLSSGIATGLAELADGSVLVSNQEGGVDRIYKDGRTQMRYIALKQKEHIRSLIVDSRQNIWIGSYAGVLKIAPDGTKTSYDQSNILPENRVRVIFEDSKRNIWFGFRAGGLLKMSPDGTTKAYRKKNGLHFDFVMCISEDLRGNIYAGSNENGLAIIPEHGPVQYMDKSTGLAGDMVFAVKADKDSVVWAVTSGGVSRIKNGRTINFTHQNGLIGESVFDFVEDGNGSVWLPSNKGLVELKKQELTDFALGRTKKIHYKMFDKSDGMSESRCNALASHLTASNGKIYFATLDGVAVLDPFSVFSNQTPPPVHITNLIVDGETKDILNGNIEIAPGNHRLQFDFTALSLVAPEKNAFRFFIEKHEDAFGAPSRERRAVYTNLPPGDYVFRVTAANNDGIWAEKEASLRFRIQPHFYQRPLFIYLSVMLTAALVFALYRLRISQIKGNTKKLEKLVYERTKEIDKQNRRILSQNDELIAQSGKLEDAYKNIRLLSKIGQEITTLLDVEEIIDTVYEEVNALMDASAFGIGVYNREKHRIDFPGFIEEGRKLPFHSDDLGDFNSLSDWCFEKQSEILISDFSKEYKKYIFSEFELPNPTSKPPKSLIFLPLIVKGKPVGNITVQSFKNNAYTETHVDVLRNLAVYVAIALENADAYRQLDDEKEKSEKLLLNILPKEIAQELKNKRYVKPRFYQSVTVLFTDFKGFSQISEDFSPEEIVDELDVCFLAFDEICEKHGLEKIKTIGDAYMCAGGIPLANATHPADAVRAGLEMQAFMNSWKEMKMSRRQQPWELRLGIHTGKVVAGVIGKNKFAYDIWGDAVNIASRMESSGEVGRVNISGATYELVKTMFEFEHRGKISAKNKGEIDMYFVIGEQVNRCLFEDTNKQRPSNL